MTTGQRAASSEIFHFSGFRFETGAGRLWSDGDELPLRPKAAAVLGDLLRHAGDVVRKEELLSAAWPEGFVGDAVLTGCINELRRVIGDDARDPRYIATAHRRGYRFVAPVSLAPHAATAGHQNAASPGRRRRLFVGRRGELATLDGWWQLARAGERQLVFVAAQAGVGKTTLVDELIERLGAEEPPPLVGRGQCVEYLGEGEPYLPILEALADIGRGPAGHHVREVLAASAPTWLIQLPSLIDTADLESLRMRALGATSGRMLREAANALDVIAARHPLVLVCEDMHDGDESTANLLTYLARRSTPARLMLVCTYRPAEALARAIPFQRAVRDLRVRDRCRHLSLELLSAAAIEEYLVHRLAPRRPSSTLVADLHQRTEGNALFVETVVDYLVDRGLLHDVEDGHVGSRDPLDRLGIPESTLQFIERQVESLGDEDRRLLEVAAAVGMQFSAESVRAGLRSDVEVADIEDRCQRLVRRSALLSDTGSVEWPDGTVSARYQFSHAMYQEVLYEHLRSPARRAAVHLGIARRLSRGFGPAVDQVATELAMHFERGRDFAAAADHLGQAAEKALQRSAHRDALDHTRRALDLLEHATAGSERGHSELRLRLTEAAALIIAKGLGAPEVEQAYRAAGELAEQVGDDASRMPVLCGLWWIALGRPDLRVASDVAEQLERLVQQHPEPAALLQVHNILGRTKCLAGAPTDAVRHVDAALAIFDPDAHRLLAILYDEDPGVVLLSYAGVVAWQLGRPDQSRERTAEALRLARDLDYPSGLCGALSQAAIVHQLCGEAERVRALSEELAAVSREHDLPTWASVAKVFLGWCRARSGDIEQAISMMRAGLAGCAAEGVDVMRPYHSSLLAESVARTGDTEAALEIVTDMIDVSRATGERWFEPELLRQRGELLLAAASRADPGNGDTASPAEHDFVEAHERAERTHSKSFELRAATSLARLWRSRGQMETARILLAETYASFDEGHDTADLTTARAVLDTLG